MSGSFDDQGRLITTNGAIVTCLGKKRSGKSVVAMMLVKSFPGDVIVIDVAGDDGPEGPGVVEWRGGVDELPRRFPGHLRQQQERIILRYIADAGSSTFIEDMDAVVGVAMAHSSKERPALLVVHEVGVLAQSGRVPPHTRRVLMHNRHRGLCAVFCGPRPITTDPLVVAQADVVYCFRMPGDADRKRLVDNIGWDFASFTEANESLADHEMLRYDANEPAPPDDAVEETRLRHLPALPEDEVRRVLDWAHHVPGPGRRPHDPSRALLTALHRTR